MWLFLASFSIPIQGNLWNIPAKKYLYKNLSSTLENPNPGRHSGFGFGPKMSGEKSPTIPVIVCGSQIRGRQDHENWPLRTFRWFNVWKSQKKWDFWGPYMQHWQCLKSPISKHCWNVVQVSLHSLFEYTASYKSLFALNTTTTTRKKTANGAFPSKAKCPPLPPKKGKPTTSWRCKKSLQHTNVRYIHQHLLIQINHLLNGKFTVHPMDPLDG